MPTSLWAVLFAVTAVVVLRLIWRELSGPSPIQLSSPATVREVFRTTLRNGAPGARVRLQVASEPGIRVDFRKYFSESGAVGLCAVLEETRQSAKHLGAINAALERRGIPFVLASDARRRAKLEIDVASDLSRAEAVANCIFEEAMGLAMARDVVGVYDLVLLTNEPSITGVND